MSASKTESLGRALVQTDIQGFFEQAHEEGEGIYTRPTLDYYLLNKYWNFITKGLSNEEIEDLQKANEKLEHYEKIYRIFGYLFNLMA